ncbi:MAG: hypothetical protein ACI9PN_002282, partial [Candidatus Azotimanducaceae bacterium]
MLRVTQLTRSEKIDLIPSIAAFHGILRRGCTRSVTQHIHSHYDDIAVLRNAEADLQAFIDYCKSTPQLHTTGCQ